MPTRRPGERDTSLGPARQSPGGGPGVGARFLDRNPDTPRSWVGLRAFEVGQRR